MPASFDTTLSVEGEVPVFVSTGKLPPGTQVKTLIDAACARYRTNDEGQNAQHYPALAEVPRELFGICVASINGATYSAGDAAAEFTIMSVAKPFVFALACQEHGPEAVREQIGVNATGLPFNSIMAVELNAERVTNPMVNTGAMAATSLVRGDTAEAKWQCIQDGLSAFAGRQHRSMKKCLLRPRPAITATVAWPLFSMAMAGCTLTRLRRSTCTRASRRST